MKEWLTKKISSKSQKAKAISDSQPDCFTKFDYASIRKTLHDDTEINNAICKIVNFTRDQLLSITDEKLLYSFNKLLTLPNLYKKINIWGVNISLDIKQKIIRQGKNVGII